MNEKENEEFSIPLPPKPPPDKEKVVVEKEIRFLDNGIEALPPNALDLEKVVLGSLLIDSSSKGFIALMEPDIFYGPKHRHIFRAMQSLDNAGIGIDILTVSDELKRMGRIDEAGGDYYVISLSNLVGSAAHIDFHIRIVLQKYVLRELIYMSRKTIFDSLHRDPDIFSLMEKIENKIASVGNVALRQLNTGTEDAQQELKSKVDMLRSGINPGYPIGVWEFDEWRGGFQPRWLITIAARPGMGKTTSIISIIAHMVEKGIPVTFFSLEMSATDLKFKLVARMTGLPFEKINKGDLTDEELNMATQALQSIEASCLTIVDDIFNLDKIVSETRKMARDGVKVFFLDYVQLVTLTRDTDNETAKLTTITRTLKALTNELNIPFVQLAQLSRDVDKRSGHRPQLSDLKMSGSIEEDSDMVIFILRPEYYNKEKSKLPPIPGDTNPEYIAEWIVAKGRSTGTRDFDVYIDLSKMKMETLGGIQF